MALSSLFLALILAVTLVVAQNPAAGLVRHMVSFRFAANVSDDLQEEVQQRYFALQKLCVNTTTGKPYIVSFDGGAPNSLEGKQQNVTQYAPFYPFSRTDPLIWLLFCDSSQSEHTS